MQKFLKGVLWTAIGLAERACCLEPAAGGVHLVDAPQPPDEVIMIAIGHLVPVSEVR